MTPINISQQKYVSVRVNLTGTTNINDQFIDFKYSVSLLWRKISAAQADIPFVWTICHLLLLIFVYM